MPSKGKSGGLLFGFKLDRFDIGSRSQGDFILQHNLWDKKLSRKWTTLNVYAVAHDDDKDSFLVEHWPLFDPKIKNPM
jgi:hypothetical protein